MSGTSGALGEIKTKTEKETNDIGGKGEKKRGRKAENLTYQYSKNRSILSCTTNLKQK